MSAVSNAAGTPANAAPAASSSVAPSAAAPTAAAAVEPILAARDSLWEKTADRLNPILVKESRQALKSRQFLFTFLLLLIAAWAVSVFGMALSSGSLEYGTAGREFFFAFYVVLAVATTLAVPFGAHRSLLSERDLNTYDLLSITTLSPGKIVRGKLASAVLQLFLFYSAITPFMAFASLLNGFDAPTAAFVLVATFFWSLMLCTAALMFATLAKNRLAQAFLSLVVLCGLGLGLAGDLAIASEIVDEGRIPFDEPEFWYAMGFILMIGGTYFALFQQITTAQLTFDADNRSTGIRLAATAQFCLLFISILAMAVTSRSMHFSNDEFQVMIVLGALHWSVFGLFAVTEPDVLSRRVRRDLPRWRILRLALLPFLSGGARGYLWIVLSVTALWWCAVLGHAVLVRPTSYAAYPPPVVGPAGTIAPAVPFGGSPVMMQIVTGLVDQFEALATRAPDDWPSHLQMTTALCLYMLFFLGLGCAMGRWLRGASREITAAHVRVLTFLVLMAGTMLPFLIRAATRERWNSFVWYDVANPFATVGQLWNGRGYAPLVIVLVGGGASILLVLNLRAVLRATRAILAPHEWLESRRTPPTELAPVAAPAPQSPLAREQAAPATESR